MANNSLQFSEAITHLTPAECAWLERQLEDVYVFGDQEFSLNELPAGLNSADADWCGPRALRRDGETSGADDDGELGFGFSLQEDSDFGWHLWLYAEEYGDPEKLASFVQQFLRDFRPRECFWLTYALSCSKLRLGEFGGGAAFVTVEDITSCDAYSFCEERRRQFATLQNDHSQSDSSRNSS